MHIHRYLLQHPSHVVHVATWQYMDDMNRMLLFHATLLTVL
jgi:hypothetical protein